MTSDQDRGPWAVNGEWTDDSGTRTDGLLVVHGSSYVFRRNNLWFRATDDPVRKGGEEDA